jgi:translocation and assembly module TamB
MTDSSATTVTPSSPKRPKKSVWARILIACLLGIVLLGAFLVGMLHSDRGSALLWKTAVHLSGDTLQGQYESGSFAKGVTLRDLQVRTPSADIRISQLDSDWDLQVFSRIFTINTLQIGDVDVTLKETEASASSGLPERITLPLSLHLNAIRLANLRLHQQGTVTSFSALQLHANSDQVQHALTIEHLTTPYGEFIANLQLNGQRPFNVTGQAALTGTYTNEPYQIKTQLNGSLEELRLVFMVTN